MRQDLKGEINWTRTFCFLAFLCDECLWLERNTADRNFAFVICLFLSLAKAFGGYKKCEHCAEDILKEAKVCRYCTRDVGTEEEKDL